MLAIVSSKVTTVLFHVFIFELTTVKIVMIKVVVQQVVESSQPTSYYLL